jgi:hypothetical protein
LDLCASRLVPRQMDSSSEVAGGLEDEG